MYECLEDVDIVVDDKELLLSLPGVGYKVMVMVMFACFGTIRGIAVDRHVWRWCISNGDGMAAMDPNGFQKQIERAYFRRDWIRLNYIVAGIAQCLQQEKDASKRENLVRDIVEVGGESRDSLYNYLMFYV